MDSNIKSKKKNIKVIYSTEEQFSLNFAVKLTQYYNNELKINSTIQSEHKSLAAYDPQSVNSHWNLERAPHSIKS